MALITRLAGSTETPDAFYGGNAVAGITSGGHGDNQAGASVSIPGGGSPDSDAETKSARWFNYTGIVGSVIKDVRLRMNWEIFGSADVIAGAGGSSGSAGSSSFIEYTSNGGAGWVTVVSDSCAADTVTSNDSYAQNGELNVSLGATQNLANIQIRDVMSANASAEAGEIVGADAQANGHIIITNLRVELTTQDNNVIVLM